MEPIISKLQEGVKYPRFERDATTIINDLVEHITKERGVYSSSIEPNPSEHNIWFNTNDNTLYIYNKGVWKSINNDNNIDILNDSIVFYCSKGTLYYTGGNVSNGGNGIDIFGFYNKDRLKYIIENFEGKTIENMSLQSIFIELEDNTTIIIGKDKFITDIAILGDYIHNANIHMYNNTLRIGNIGDEEITGDPGLYNSVIYCNRKQIGDITITSKNSSKYININSCEFIVGNNNILKIDESLAEFITSLCIYVLKELDNDKSKVNFVSYISSAIKTYINLCSTPIEGKNTNSIKFNTIITTTIDDIDIEQSSSPVNMEECKELIIDASYRPFKTTSFINYIKGLSDEYINIVNIYVTDIQLFNFLKGQGLTPIMAVANNSYYDDKVVVNYKKTDGTDIYNNTIYKR